jgi:hypothetical protein
VAEFEKPSAGVIETDAAAAQAHVIEERRPDRLNQFVIHRLAPLRQARRGQLRCTSQRPPGLCLLPNRDKGGA